MIYQHSYQVASPYKFSANCIMLDVFLKHPVAEDSYLWENPRLQRRKEQNATLLFRAAQSCGKRLALGLLGYRSGTKERKN